MIKSIFKKMKAKANIKAESTMLVDILKKAEKKHKQEKSLAAKLITTPKFSVDSLSKDYTDQIMDISSKKFSQVTLQQWLPSKEPKIANLID